jgi:hypothetical protein
MPPMTQKEINKQARELNSGFLVYSFLCTVMLIVIILIGLGVV